VIRSNLATRPFYNERAVRFWIVLVGIAVSAATVFNASQMIRYSRSDTELARQAASDEARAAELRAEAARLRATVDTKQIELASIEARQANDLIDRRTFSWTELFNRLEAMLPADVRITSVRPRLEEDRIALAITVVARGVRDAAQFQTNLENSGFFADILSAEQINEAGQLEAALETTYIEAR
jgi:Tfp pilus assembly protein PilN